MKLAIVGIGGAGSRLVDRFLDAERRLDRPCCGNNVLVFDTSRPDLDALESVPKDRRVPVGDTHPGVDQSGPGAGGDPELGAEVTREERHEIRRELDELEVFKADAVVVFAGLGGGTGTGGGAVLVEEFKSIYDTPVYAAVTLPSAEESDDRALNAVRGLKSFVPTADNVLLFDNDDWYPEVAQDSDEATEDGDENGDGPPWTPEERRELNDVFTTRLVSLFGAGEYARSSIPETAVDTSDLMRTLATGGVSSIGRARLDEPSRGFLARFWSFFSRSSEDESLEAPQITELVRRALQSRLTIGCDVTGAERVMFVLSGPPKKLPRRGFENATYWLEEETGAAEVLAGDEPRPYASQVTASVLLSNVAEVPRIEALHRQVVDAESTAEDTAAADEDASALTRPSNPDD